MLSREDYLLLFIGAPGGAHRLDRIRTMKGMFLLTEERPPGLPKIYDFVGYDWGPFSKQVYDDLARLLSQDLIAVDGEARHSYETYRITKLGEERSAEMEAHVTPEVAAKIAEVKLRTTSMTFLDLLEYVYEKHPQYAKRSKLRR